MVLKFTGSALVLGFYSTVALALQVSPGSPCASVCLETPAQNTSDTIAFITSASEIACVDGDFQGTSVGIKYMSCLQCLQTSTFSISNQDDQGWFLYNLRYALDSCLFSYPGSPSDSINSHCNTLTECGPLQDALSDGDLNPANQTDYSYCSADNNAFLGSVQGQCTSCLQSTDNQKYLSNFLIALHVGCTQPPHPGSAIGIQGSLFSPTPINITYPGYTQPAAASTGSKHKGGLPQGAIIGIAVAIVVIVVIAIAVLFVCFRKRRQNKASKGLSSPLHARFGAKDITSPVDGAYGNPYSVPQVHAIQPFDPTAFSKRELDVLKDAQDVLAKHQPGTPPFKSNWQDALATSVPIYNGPAIPTHQAYIPGHSGPVSPANTADSMETESTNLKSYASSKSSPKAPTHTAPTHTAKAIPPPIQVPKSTQPIPQQIPQPSTAQLRSEEEMENSRIYNNRGLHSRPQSALDGRPPSRSHSRAESWKRGNSRTSRQGLSNTNASAETPILSAGSGVWHGGRFDFELAERDRLEQEHHGDGKAPKRKNLDGTPVSAEGEEMWPGSY